ncbi:hypothetical protein SR39_07070 [Methylobacterium radiotolerans]|nr:hypothetical protein SR39_07070 [Methylobacterium radiotolerans]
MKSRRRAGDDPAERFGERARAGRAVGEVEPVQGRRLDIDPEQHAPLRNPDRALAEPVAPGPSEDADPRVHGRALPPPADAQAPAGRGAAAPVRLPQSA